MNALVDQIVSMLGVEPKNDVRIIGIWGMCGVGKTNVVERTFRRISSRFAGSYFRRDLSQESHGKEPYSLLDDFLSTMVGGQFSRGAFTIKSGFLEKLLQNRRILVVLDDVDCFRDVEHLVGIFNTLGPGSRVIITSRSRDVLAQCMVKEIHKMEKLEAKESLQLLSLYSSGASEPEEKYLRRSIDMKTYADGNPLALEVLGSLLRGRPVQEWNVSLLNFRQPEAFKLLNALRRSYNLLDKNEKKIFLDLACFFEGMNKDRVVDILDGCGFFTDIGIDILLDKSLVNVVENRVQMHYFIKEMGREIVHRESEEPQWRSRLWNAEDIASMLNEHKGTEAIEGIFLDTSNLSINLSPGAFHRMYKLRLLKIYYSILQMHSNLSLPQGLEYLPRQLRLLHWEFCPLRSLPRSFDPENLVELNLPYSSIEKLWEGTKNLKKLKRMGLSHSRCLTEIPTLSKAWNLESLDLEECTSLVELDSSITKLNKLVILNAKDCLMLERFPNTVFLESLEVLNLSGCSKLENFPELPQNLKELYLGGTGLRHVPSSIENVSGLVKLDLENCRSLKVVPSSISKLKFLAFLNLSGCSKLESFPQVLVTMESLRYLDLTKTLIKELPSSISNLVALEEIRLESRVNPSSLLERLRGKVKFNEDSRDTSSLGLPFKSLSFMESQPYSLVELRLQKAHIREVPEDICKLASLEVLDLSQNDFSSLPAKMKRLYNLRKLKLSYCRKLKSLPLLPESLDYLDAHGCASLKFFRPFPILFKFENISVFSHADEHQQRRLKEIFANVVERAWRKAQTMPKQFEKGLLKPPSLTICIPTQAYLRGLLQQRGFTTRKLFQQRRSPWGLALFVMVGFAKEYPTDAGLAIRCIYKLSRTSTLERIFCCWSPDIGERPIPEEDHTCIFYDDSLYQYLAECGGDTIISFEFYPVDLENKLLSSCSVEKCGVFMLSWLQETTQAEGTSIPEQKTVQQSGILSITGPEPLESSSSPPCSRSRNELEISESSVTSAFPTFATGDKSSVQTASPANIFRGESIGKPFRGESAGKPAFPAPTTRQSTAKAFSWRLCAFPANRSRNESASPKSCILTALPSRFLRSSKEKGLRKSSARHTAYEVAKKRV